MSRLGLLILSPVAPAFAAAVQRELPEVDLFPGSDGVRSLDSCPDAQVVIGAPSASALEHAPALRWIQLPGPDVPADLCDIARRRGIVLTRTSSPLAPLAAERAMAALLALVHEPGHAGPTKTLAGATLGILGTGQVGRRIARLARAFGMQIVGYRRTDEPAPWFDRIFMEGELAEVARRAAAVIVALPLTAKTAVMVDGAFFDALPMGVPLVCLSDERVIQSEAMAAATARGRVRGLNFFPPEPASSSDPAGPFWLRNLHHYLAGEPLEDLVDLEGGY